MVERDEVGVNVVDVVAEWWVHEGRPLVWKRIILLQTSPINQGVVFYQVEARYLQITSAHRYVKGTTDAFLKFTYFLHH